MDSMHVTSWFDEVTGKCEVIRIMPYSIRRKTIEEAKLKDGQA